ncbi:MAG TPA: hypothetical protein VH143_07795 [Kofleriaceae bacterium]|jgi:hypothetical protein|nr:hypothetical protein [Kofleriaceae bacterium]
MTRAALVWLIAAGCWRDPPPVAPDPQAAPAPETATLRPQHTAPTPCELAIDHALSLVEQLGDVDPVFTAQEAHLRPLLVEHCERMQWSDDALQCVRDAQTPDELYAHCRDRFTQDQLTDVVRVVQPPPP